MKKKSKRTLELRPQKEIELTLGAEDLTRADSKAGLGSASGFAVISASGFAVISASGFAVISASGFAVI